MGIKLVKSLKKIYDYMRNTIKEMEQVKGWKEIIKSERTRNRQRDLIGKGRTCNNNLTVI